MNELSCDCSTNPFLAAKSEASVLIHEGVLVHPKVAMYAAGIDRKIQTLWSIAFRYAGSADISAEALHEYLEASFPQYSLRFASRSLSFVW